MTVNYLDTRDVDLDRLIPFPGNAKRGDIPKIRASLRQGQYRSIVVRSMLDGSMVILAGNNTAIAMREEGWSAARCEIVECDDDQARRINVKDNAISDRGVYDQSALAEIMSSFGGDYTDVGFDDDDAARLFASVASAQADATSFLNPEPAPTPEPEPAGPAGPSVAPTTRPSVPWVPDAPKAEPAPAGETPEQAAARAERRAAREAREAEMTADMVLTYLVADRDEIQRLVAAAQEVLGRDMRASEVMLRAMRTLVAVLDERHRAEPVRMARFARAAGAADLLGQ